MIDLSSKTATCGYVFDARPTQHNHPTTCLQTTIAPSHPINITPHTVSRAFKHPPAMASNTDASAPQRPGSPTGSPRGPSATSLQAAATVNAGLNRELSPRKLQQPATVLVTCGNTDQAPPGSSTSSLTRAHRSSSNAGRRRSNVLMNLQLNDPTVPGPGEMVSEHGFPQHHRAPSLGELHQELEAEQESHVVGRTLAPHIRQLFANVLLSRTGCFR